MLRKTTCSRKSVEIHGGTATFIEIDEALFMQEFYRFEEKGVFFDIILVYVKRGFLLWGIRGIMR